MVSTLTIAGIVFVVFLALTIYGIRRFASSGGGSAEPRRRSESKGARDRSE